MPKRRKRALRSDSSAIKDEIEAQLEKQRQQEAQAEKQGLKLATKSPPTVVGRYEFDAKRQTYFPRQRKRKANNTNYFSGLHGPRVYRAQQIATLLHSQEANQKPLAFQRVHSFSNWCTFLETRRRKLRKEHGFVSHQELGQHLSSFVDNTLPPWSRSIVRNKNAMMVRHQGVVDVHSDAQSPLENPFITLDCGNFRPSSMLILDSHWCILGYGTSCQLKLRAFGEETSVWNIPFPFNFNDVAWISATSTLYYHLSMRTHPQSEIIEQGMSIRSLNIDLSSEVLTLNTIQDNAVLAGCRNGTVHLVDHRQPEPTKSKSVAICYENVTRILPVSSYQFLVKKASGICSLWDLRHNQRKSGLRGGQNQEKSLLQFTLPVAGNEQGRCRGLAFFHGSSDCVCLPYIGKGASEDRVLPRLATYNIHTACLVGTPPVCYDRGIIDMEVATVMCGAYSERVWVKMVDQRGKYIVSTV